MQARSRDRPVASRRVLLRPELLADDRERLDQPGKPPFAVDAVVGRVHRVAADRNREHHRPLGTQGRRELRHRPKIAVGVVDGSVPPFEADVLDRRAVEDLIERAGADLHVVQVALPVLDRLVGEHEGLRLEVDGDDAMAAKRRSERKEAVAGAEVQHVAGLRAKLAQRPRPLDVPVARERQADVLLRGDLLGLQPRREAGHAVADGRGDADCCRTGEIEGTHRAASLQEQPTGRRTSRSGALHWRGHGDHSSAPAARTRHGPAAGDGLAVAAAARRLGPARAPLLLLYA